MDNSVNFRERPDQLPAGEGGGAILSSLFYDQGTLECSADPTIVYFHRPNICGLNLDASGTIISAMVSCIAQDGVAIFHEEDFSDVNCETPSNTFDFEANVCNTEFFNDTLAFMSRCDNFEAQGTNELSTQALAGIIVAGFAALVCLLAILLCVGVSLLTSKKGEIESVDLSALGANTRVIKYSDLKMEQQIGKGAFGEVWKASWKGRDVAVKKQRQAHGIEDALKEFEIQFDIPEHANVVTLLGFVAAPVSIVLEFCDGGSLRDYLDSEVEIPKRTNYQWMLEIASGVRHIHSQKIIHRDLVYFLIFFFFFVPPSLLI